MEAIATFVRDGGFFLYINFFWSALALALVVDRAAYFLTKAQVNARAFLENIRKLVAANSIDRAIKLCQATPAPIARVARAGLSRFNKGEAAVATAIEETLVDVTPELKKRISIFWSVANIATLIGLLGTVTGLIKGFAAVASAPADQRQTLLAGRIAEAMNNTAMGLGIAVFCIIWHLVFSSVSKRAISDLDAFSLKLENLLMEAQPNSGAGGQ
jgi:biopolymer transport protein ExbB/TolQ